MARIDQWGRWPVVFTWLLAIVMSILVLGAAGLLAEGRAELAAAVAALGIPLLLAGAMKVTWRWLTGTGARQ